MIAQRERELAQLRADSIAALEQQVGAAATAERRRCTLLLPWASSSARPAPSHPPSRSSPPLVFQVAARDAALRELEGRLAALQSDFEHNLGLLGGRDEELARCEAALAAAGSELASQRELVAQMQAALGEAEQGERETGLGGGAGAVQYSEQPGAGFCLVPGPCLRTNTTTSTPNAALASEHAARTAAERQLAQQRRTLLTEVQAARAEGDAALRQLQHQADVQQRRLEAELDRQVAAAAEQQAAAAAAHAAALRQLEVRGEAGDRPEWSWHATQRACLKQLRSCLLSCSHRLCPTATCRQHTPRSCGSCSYVPRWQSSWRRGGTPRWRRPTSGCGRRLPRLR